MTSSDVTACWVVALVVGSVFASYKLRDWLRTRLKRYHEGMIRERVSAEYERLQREFETRAMTEPVAKLCDLVTVDQSVTISRRESWQAGHDTIEVSQHWGDGGSRGSFADVDRNDQDAARRVLRSMIDCDHRFEKEHAPKINSAIDLNNSR